MILEAEELVLRELSPAGLAAIRRRRQKTEYAAVAKLADARDLKSLVLYKNGKK